MAHLSQRCGQMSPPDSVSDDETYERAHPSRHLVAAPYHTPPMNAVQTYNYADPEQYGLQDDQRYYATETYPESVYRTPPQPIRGGGIQTRSGRSLGTPTSVGSPSSKVSPSPRSKRNKKAKDKSLEARITEPLSSMTASYDIPVEDMHAWVTRPNDARWEEVKGRPKNNIPRPMNSFMLYRRAYKERIKKWGQQGDNNQMISSVAGLSWNMEPSDVKDFYTRMANLEKENHATAFPDYKFTPNKNVQKRGRDDDEEEEDSDPEWDGGLLYGSKRRRGYSDRDVTRSRSPTPGQMTWSSAFHGSQYPGDARMVPIPQTEQWTHPDPYARYGQYPSMQLAYGQPMHPISYGPTSVPMYEQRYVAPPVGLPPGMDAGLDDPMMVRSEYGIDPGLEEHFPQSNSYHYGSYIDGHPAGLVDASVEYANQVQEPMHPGMQTLVPAESSWEEGTENIGSAFDTELNRWQGRN